MIYCRPNVCAVLDYSILSMWPSFRMNTSGASPIIASSFGLCCRLSCGVRALSKPQEGLKLRFLPFSRLYEIKKGGVDVMKTKILFPLVILMVMSAWVTVTAQTETGLSQVALYWFSPGRIPPVEKTDRSRSSINFETGQRGPDVRDYDLRY